MVLRTDSTDALTIVMVIVVTVAVFRAEVHVPHSVCLLSVALSFLTLIVIYS